MINRSPRPHRANMSTGTHRGLGPRCDCGFGAVYRLGPLCATLALGGVTRLLVVDPLSVSVGSADPSVPPTLRFAGFAMADRIRALRAAGGPRLRWRGGSTDPGHRQLRLV